MAVIVAPERPHSTNPDWRLYVSLGVSLAFLVLWFGTSSPVLHFGSFAVLLAAGLSWANWGYSRARRRARLAVNSRLNRLPDDFMLMGSLEIPSPWGHIRLDEVVLSRFGIVIVSAGPPQRWLMEQVEAVRSHLFAKGLLWSGLPIGSLILLPPGLSAPLPAADGAPIIRVESLRLEHLAPSRTPVLTQAQIRELAECLVQTQ